MNYARYQPSRRRPLGAGAFFDWTVFVGANGTLKLKSCRIDRRWNRQPSGRFAAATARRRWPRLTRADLEAIGTDRERLQAKIGELYAIPPDQARRDLATWLHGLGEVNPFR